MFFVICQLFLVILCRFRPACRQTGIRPEPYVSCLGYGSWVFWDPHPHEGRKRKNILNTLLEDSLLTREHAPLLTFFIIH